MRRGAATMVLLIAAAPALPGDTGAQTTPPRASAVLSTPSACARVGRVRAVVSGSQIERVVFSLDGRRARTLTQPNAGVRWVYARRIRTLRRGRHHIVARVEFTAETRRSAATLRGQFRRCRGR